MKTLIVGNSLAVVPAIEATLQEDQDALITLFATEGTLPYDRSLLPGLLAGTVKENPLHFFPEKFFQQRRVDLVTAEQLDRISIKRRYLTTTQKTRFSYDRLWLVDTGALILPTIKGLQKKGVFDCWRLPSVRAIIKRLPFVDHAALTVTNVQGLNMACALVQGKKEVTVISKGPGILPDVFDDETGLLLKQILEDKGVRVIAESKMEEILGESEVKAIRLTSGKVLACELVLFDEARVDIRMLSEPDLSGTDKIVIEDCFKPPVMPLAPTHFGQPVLDGFFAGWTKLPEGGREYLKFDGPQNIYKKIFLHGPCAVGAVTFNVSPDKERLWELIRQKTDISGQEEQLL